jgi:hypothetical protein
MSEAQFFPVVYTPAAFKSSFTGWEGQNPYLRPAVILAINSTAGTINVEWLDHPGSRSDLPISFAGQGIFEMPTPGAVVLMGFDKAYQAHILRFIQPGYAALINNNTIWGIQPGEKMLVSYLNDSIVNKERQFALPIPTGTYLHLNNVGDILMTTADGDYWQLNRREQLIEQYSLNHSVRTEAGILDFGLIKRSTADGIKIISAAGKPLDDSSASQNSLTEFRLRVLETADASIETTPEIDNPFIELTLGTKLKETINNDDSRQYELAKTDNSYAGGADKEIMIQLKTKADQGFEFTVDKDGNLTMKVKGNIKFDITNGNMLINVGDNGKVQLGGENGEKTLLGESFQKKFNALVDYINSLYFTNTAGAPTPCFQGAPAGTAQKSTSTDLSNKVNNE